MAAEQMKFEDAMQELEEVTKKLEGGSLSLAESLTVYERGVELLTYCKKTLDHAQLRLQELTDKAKGDPHDESGASGAVSAEN